MASLTRLLLATPLALVMCAGSASKLAGDGGSSGGAGVDGTI